MIFKVAKSKKEGLEQLKKLIRTFEEGKGTYRSQSYNETQTRKDFIDPLLMCFGWDVNNEDNDIFFLRKVVQEESISFEDSSAKKNPDYTLRVEGLRKFFVEAKKPSIDISKSKESAFQIRRYGWNANLGLSILTNFEELIIFDCRYKPIVEENERVARVECIKFKDYIDQFDHLYELISFESALEGKIDELFSISEIEGQTFDEFFLEQIENWREKLAQSAIDKNSELNNDNLNFLIQRLLNRIIFLRICEDRAIEKYETLKTISTYEELKKLFQRADTLYNSGLFDFIEDTISLNIDLDSEILIEIFSELYYPLSPYDFSVVDSDILSQIYEKFLGSQLKVVANRQVSIEERPEVTASNGVVPTPKIIVDQIVSETLTPLTNGKQFNELSGLKIADICCGSGTFLIKAFDYLTKKFVEKYLEENIDDSTLVYKSSEGTLHLSLKAKRLILLNNLYGVDINPYAVEVTKFSLLLKLLENESKGSIKDFIQNNDKKVLPNLSANIKCGNSLVDNRFLEYKPDVLEDDELFSKLNIFNWPEEFPFLVEQGGFDAIIGNPPYIRIQNLVKYIPEEIKYYQSKKYGYQVAKNQTIDKYYVFIQKAISLLNKEGYLGYITPNKFFIVKGGKELRKFITANVSVSKIIHFGVTQVFPGRSTYTAILILQKSSIPVIKFLKLNKVAPKLLNDPKKVIYYDQEYISDKPWVFVSKATKEVFDKVHSDNTIPLKELSSISVGLQTSADDIYIFSAFAESYNTYKITSGDEEWEIEKRICKPCLYDSSFSLFDTVHANAQIVFPYELIEGKAELIDEDRMQEEFPLCWNYLLAHKEKLEGRSINGIEPKWYQFGRSQSLSKFHNTPKLIWHVLSTKPTYILDNNDLQFTGGGNGPYYSLINESEYSILYLLGILAHPLFEAMIKSRASEFRGEYYSHGKQFIQNLPIRTINFEIKSEKEGYLKIVKTVEQLIDTKQVLDSTIGQRNTIMKRKYEMLMKSLIASVNDLYRISNEDVNQILDDEMFKNEILTE